MVRAAAKNHPSVAIVTSPARYPDVLAAVAAGGFTLAERKRLAAEAFAHTAAYDVAVASWCAQRARRAPTTAGPRSPGRHLAEVGGAALRRERPPVGGAVPRGRRRAGPRPRRAAARQGDVLQQLRRRRRRPTGRPTTSTGPAVAIIKHTNPCGIAVGADVAEAHRKAHACDPVSAFGGVIATNLPVSVAMAAQVAEVFTEVDRGAGATTTARSRCSRARRTSGILVRATRRRPAGRAAADQRRHPRADAATTSTLPATTRPPGRWSAARPASGRGARRPRVRVDRPAGR